MEEQVVNCVAYVDGQRIGAVDIEDISEILLFPGQFIWIGLHEPGEELLRQVQAEFGLHDLAVEDAHRAHQRPKIEEYGDSLFVALRTAQRVKQKIEFGETHLFVGPRYVVLYAIMDFIVDNYFPLVQMLMDEIEELEEQLFDGSLRETSRRIYDLKRQLVQLKRAISPLIEVCNRLVRFDITLIQPETRLYFRDVYDHVIRINESIDTARELLTGALETNLTLASVRQNEVMKKLAGWGAIIAMPTMIAGIYGMNFDFMPELRWIFGYPLVLALMFAACGVLYWNFKRSGWF